MLASGWLRRLEVVTRGDAANHVGHERARLRGFREVARVVLPASRCVEVQESNRAVARVGERVQHAGGNADERSRLELVRVLAETYGENPSRT